MRYDFSNELVYVRYGQGVIGIINAIDESIVGNFKLTAHPESTEFS